MPTDPLSSPGTSSSLALRGLSVDVPDGWEVRIRQSNDQEADGLRFPVLHASTQPLPTERADYGGGVVERLGRDSVFISLVEFGPEAVGSNLYPPVEEVPRVEPSKFHPFQLQRRIPGQAGSQTFFTLAGRAFCLYVVIGSFARRAGLASLANELLARVKIDPGP
ncbi:MAG: hypothetical protein OEM39_06560 [Acidimicrobiia bacterium]|nr:hypothetical protein [Acidimicrobiia bacterium]MDH3463090.1 hypothetical protein [Acidimicrobiia bacterium]